MQSLPKRITSLVHVASTFSFCNWTLQSVLLSALIFSLYEWVSISNGTGIASKEERGGREIVSKVNHCSPGIRDTQIVRTGRQRRWADRCPPWFKVLVYTQSVENLSVRVFPRVTDLVVEGWQRHTLPMGSHSFQCSREREQSLKNGNWRDNLNHGHS